MDMLTDGDSLLRHDRDGSESEIQGIAPTFSAFAEGYRLAADRLLREAAPCDQSWDRTFLALPIVYMICHYVELTLKTILSECDKALKTSRLDQNLHHELIKLWGETKVALQDIGISRESEQMRIADELIKELGKLRKTIAVSRGDGYTWVLTIGQRG